MVPILPLIAVLVLAHATSLAAATTTTVLDVSAPGGVQRFVHLRPDAPVANVVVLSGRHLGIQSDGSMTAEAARCDPAVRNRQALADQGYAVAVVDVPLTSLSWYADIAEVIRQLQGRDLLPTWIVGGGVATGQAVSLVAGLPLGNGLGAVFHAPEAYDPNEAATIAHPSLVVYHVHDARQQGSYLFRTLISASVRHEARLVGGNNAGCDGYHTLNGLDSHFVAAVTAFVDAHNPSLVATPLADVAVAVEFHHAGLDHYFVTSLAGEIDALDSGLIAGWGRTGHSFTAWSGSAGLRAGVWRFFSASFAPRSSHFYTAFAGDLGYAFSNPARQPEGLVFHLEPSDVHGVCRAGTRPLHRLYNNGRSGAPNHRYTSDAGVRSAMVADGWTSEGRGALGVVGCVLR